MTAATVKDVAERFGQFYVPRFEIRSGGSGISPDVVRDVMSVTYNDSITEIDSVDIVVNNWDVDSRAFKYVGAETSSRGDNDTQRLFNPRAAEFEIKFGYGSELATIMRGSTTSLEPSFPASGAPTLTVRLLNVLHRLRTKKHRDHWPNNRVARGQVKISRVAQDIGERRVEGCRFPIPIRISQDALRAEPVLEYLGQDNQFDIDFLILQARKYGYVVYITQESSANGGTSEALYFGPADVLHPGVPDVAYELKWGESLVDFTPKLSTANQVTAVTVRGWDRATNRAIDKTARLSDAHINEDLHDLLTASQAGMASDQCREREELVTNIPHFTPEEAQHHAVRILEDRLNQMVEANGTTVGLPDLRAGQKVYIKGLGHRFSGRYFVTKTTHTLDDTGYRTKFTARREAEIPETASVDAITGAG
jgi:Bacteriophage probable baseplate hub protein